MNWPLEQVGAVYLGGSRSRYSAEVETFLNKLGAEVLVEDREVREAHERPLKLDACGGANLYRLAADVGQRRNSESFVLLLKYGDFSAIFPSDAEFERTGRGRA